MSDHDERNFVSIRHDRIKSLGEGNATRKTGGHRLESEEGYGALGRWDHHVRASETPNAEPTMLGHNRVWSADTKWQGLYCDRRDPRLARILKRDYLAQLTTAR